MLKGLKYCYLIVNAIMLFIILCWFISLIFLGFGIASFLHKLMGFGAMMGLETLIVIAVNCFALFAFDMVFAIVFRCLYKAKIYDQGFEKKYFVRCERIFFIVNSVILILSVIPFL